jgi:hypothetical protein
MPAGENGGKYLFDDLGLADDGSPQLLDHLRAGLRELGKILADAVAGQCWSFRVRNGVSRSWASL